MANDNFWLGVMLGHFFTKKNNNPGEQQKGGCLSTIIFWAGFLVVGAAILCIMESYIQHPVLTVITACIILILIIFTAVKILKKRKTKRLLDKTANEALELFQSGQYTPALEKAESIADKDVFAADIAGICYRNGLGCDKDSVKAFKYFEMAKDINIEAAGNYGAMLIQGEGCTADKETGLKYLTKAAVKERQAGACYEYARLLLDGIFIEKNETEGRKYLRLASEGGIADATALLNNITNN